MQHLLAKQLTPQLSLVGMSRGGCALGAAGGGGLLYVVPLKPRLFFVAGFGTTLDPPIAGARPAIVRPNGRMDLVIDRGQGRSWTVGIDTRGVSFGGLF